MTRNDSPEEHREPAAQTLSTWRRTEAIVVGIVVVLVLSAYSALKTSPSDKPSLSAKPSAPDETSLPEETSPPNGSSPTDQVVSLAVPATVEPTPDHGLTGNPAVADPDERYRRMALGTWQDFHHGKRTLIVREDGTATMIVELSGWKARMFTRRLQLNIVWTIEDGRMHRRTVGGVPADKVEFVNRRAGVAVAEPIIELTSDRMVLRDQNGSQNYHWRRVQ